MRKVKLEMQVSVDGFTADADGNTSCASVKDTSVPRSRRRSLREGESRPLGAAQK